MSLSVYDAPTGNYTSSIPPGTAAFRKVLAEVFGFTRTEVIRDRSRCAQHGSEHCECGAVDAFTTDPVKGRGVFDACVRASDVLGIQSVIFRDREVGFGNPTERYRSKADHFDHVHIGLNRWARKNLTEQMVRDALVPKEGFLADAKVTQEEWDAVREEIHDMRDEVKLIYRDHGDKDESTGGKYKGVLEGVSDLAAEFKEIKDRLAAIEAKLG